jgi:hypothetical protein
MKKSKLVELFHQLNAIKGSPEPCNIKFRYGINKNFNIVTPEINILRTIEEEDAKPLKPMLIERETFIREKGKDDGRGGKIIPFTAPYTPDAPAEDIALVEEFKAKMTELEEKYKDVLAEHEKKSVEYKTMLAETDVEPELVLYKISIEHCPDWINAGQLNLLMEVGIIE